MSDSQQPSRPSASSSPSSSSAGLRPSVERAPVAQGQLRTYEDAVLLDRVWSRLETKVARPVHQRPVSRVLSAAALLLVGVGTGIVIEKARSQPDTASLVASEAVMAPRAASGDFEITPRQNAAPPRQETKRGRRATRRASSPGRYGLEAPYSIAESEEAVTDEELLPLAAELNEPAPRPQWLQLADRGDYAAAFTELDQSGGFDAVLAGGTAEELMTLADVARFAGRHGRAIQALNVVTERYQNDESAPIAAMMLGNLLSRAGDDAGAARAYALNRTLSPGGDFAEDALSREFDMAITAMDFDRSQGLLEQYEAEFPSGRHLEDMHSAVDELARELTRIVAEAGLVGPTENPYAVREAGNGAAQDGEAGAQRGESDGTVRDPGASVRDADSPARDAASNEAPVVSAEPPQDDASAER